MAYLKIRSSTSVRVAPILFNSKLREWMAIISSLLSDASPPEARDRLKCNCKEGISKTNKFIQKVSRTTYLTLRNEEIIFIKYLITPNHLLHTLIGEIWKSSKKLSIDKSVKEVSISSVLSASTSCWISLDYDKVRRKLNRRLSTHVTAEKTYKHTHITQKHT